MTTATTVNMSGSPSRTNHPLQLMQKSSIDRIETPIMSVTSSPTSTLTRQQHQSQKMQDSQLAAMGDPNNKTTVVLCPPNRKHCF